MNKYLTVAKRAASLTATIGWAYYTIIRIQAFKHTDRAVLKPLIGEFCQRLTNAIELTVVETNPLPEGHALWASNHISWVDIIGVGSKVPAFFIAKAEIGNWPVFGPVARAAGTVLIKRGSGDSGSIAQQVAQFLREDVPVLFYPEGTTSLGHDMLKLHAKLFEAATLSGTPVHPIVICYKNRHGEIDTVIPYAGGTGFVESLLRVLQNKKTTLYVKYLDAVDPSDKTHLELAQEVEARMRVGQKQLHQEVFNRQLTSD